MQAKKQAKRNESKIKNICHVNLLLVGYTLPMPRIPKAYLDNPLKCNICDIQCQSRAGLTRHYNSKHVSSGLLGTKNLIIEDIQTDNLDTFQGHTENVDDDDGYTE